MNKKIVIIAIIIIALAAIGYMAFGNNNQDGNQTQMVDYVQNGISFKYPTDWSVCDASSNQSIAAICLGSSVDSNNQPRVNILFEKQNFTGTFDEFLNKTYTSIGADEKFNLTASGVLLINGKNATQFYYTEDANGTIKMHRAVWFEEGNDAYVVMYTAPKDTFSEYEDIFEYVLSTFKIN